MDHQAWLEAPYDELAREEARGEAFDAAKASFLPNVEAELRADGDAIADLVIDSLRDAPSELFLLLSQGRDTAEFGARVARLLDAAIAAKADELAIERMEAEIESARQDAAEYAAGVRGGW